MHGGSAQITDRLDMLHAIAGEQRQEAAQAAAEAAQRHREALEQAEAARSLEDGAGGVTDPSA